MDMFLEKRRAYHNLRFFFVITEKKSLNERTNHPQSLLFPSETIYR